MYVVAVYARRLFAVFDVDVDMRCAAVLMPYAAARMTNTVRGEYTGQLDREAPQPQLVQRRVTAADALLEQCVRERHAVGLELAPHSIVPLFWKFGAGSLAVSVSKAFDKNRYVISGPPSEDASGRASKLVLLRPATTVPRGAAL